MRTYTFTFMSSKSRNRRAGLSLLEVTIAAVILGAILFMTWMILFRTSSAATRAGLSGELEARGRALATHCKSQFHTSRFKNASGSAWMGINGDFSMVGYQLPVSREPDGDVLYGYTTFIGMDDAAGVGKSCVIRFEAAEEIRESGATTTAAVAKTTIAPLPALPVLTSTTWKFDLNRDGDKNDTFVRGKIKKYVIAADGVTIQSTESLSDHVVFACAGGSDYTSDVDGSTGTPADDDLLFMFVDKDGNKVVTINPTSTCVGMLVQVWHGNFDEYSKGFLLRRYTELVRFRNKQQ